MLENGVRLSLNLYQTMGSSASARIVFVYLIQSQSVTDFVNESRNSPDTAVNGLSQYKCKELYLETIPPKIGSVNRDMQASIINLVMELSHRLRLRCHISQSLLYLIRIS